jgi:hypothetical protein
VLIFLILHFQQPHNFFDFFCIFPVFESIPVLVVNELNNDPLQALSVPASLASLFVIGGISNAARVQFFAVASSRLVLRLRQQLFDQADFHWFKWKIPHFFIGFVTAGFLF